MQIGIEQPWWESVRQGLDRVSQVVVVHSDPVPGRDWLMTIATMVSALATAIVGGLAVWELRKSRKEAEKRREIVTDRICTEAFRLQRNIESWLADTDSLTPTAQLDRWRTEGRGEFDEAEHRLTSMVLQAPYGLEITYGPLVYARDAFYDGVRALQSASVIRAILHGPTGPRGPDQRPAGLGEGPYSAEQLELNRRGRASLLSCAAQLARLTGN